MLAYEPLLDTPFADGVRLLGMEAIRGPGQWPAFRHVFDLEHDAALYVDVDPLGGMTLFAVGFDVYADETLTPL